MLTGTVTNSGNAFTQSHTKRPRASLAVVPAYQTARQQQVAQVRPSLSPQNGGIARPTAVIPNPIEVPGPWPAYDTKFAAIDIKRFSANLSSLM